DVQDPHDCRIWPRYQRLKQRMTRVVRHMSGYGIRRRHAVALRGPGHGVKARKSAFGGAGRRKRSGSIGDLERKLASLRDQVADRLLRRQNADEIALGVHVFHSLSQTSGVAMRK